MNEIYFAQIREDAEVERAHFRDARRILTIASGGCVAFSLLTDHVSLVEAVDLNPAQTQLVTTKARAMSALSRDEFLIACGEAPGDRAAIFARAGLEVNPETRERGLLHVGATERFYRFLGQNLRRNVLNEEAWEALLKTESLDEQKAWLTRHTEGAGWQMAMRVLLSRATHEHFFPPAMFAQIEEQSFGRLFLDRFTHEVTSRRVTDNPFLHQLLYGRYREDARPAYLTATGYAEAKRNLHKLKVTTASVTSLEPEHGYDALGLSNIFDWASDEDARVISAKLQEIAIPEARVVVRQMLDARAIPLALREVSREREDRAMLYRDVACGRLA